MSRLAATLLCACAALPLGCAENQETLIVLFVPSWGTDGMCVVETDNDPQLIGLLDVAFNTPYFMPAVVLNNSGEQAVNDNNTGVVSNEIQLKDAEVTLDSPQAEDDLFGGVDSGLRNFTVALSTNSVLPGEEVGVVVEAVPLATVQALRASMRANLPLGARATVRANVVFNGTRNGNDVGKVGKVKARDFSYPITICDGCLIDCSGCENGACPPLESDAELATYRGGVCGNAQEVAKYPPSCEAPEE